MSRLFYNRNHTFNKLFWFFWNYFQDASMPSAENLFLLVISMLALDSFRSIRFAWMHIISRLTGKSLNSFYYTLSYAAFDHLRWTAVTARLVLSCIPISLRDSSVFLSIDDTLVEKYGTKFQARSNLFDHAAHNGSNYLKGHCFVSLMLHVPLKSADGITCLSVPLGCRKVITNLWKGRTVYACVTAADPGKPGSFRLFLCTAVPEEIAVEPEKDVAIL